MNQNTTTKRNADISSDVLLRCQVQSYKAGETIDGLIARLEKETGITGINRESLNVRRSQTKAKFIGEIAAKRSKILQRLDAAIATHGDASNEANDVRAELRELNQREQSYLKTFKLARKGRTGDRPGISMDELLTDIIHDEFVDSSDDSVEV